MSHQGEAGPSTGAWKAGHLTEASNFSQKQLDRIIACHGLNPTDVMLPGAAERAHLPPPGYMAYSCAHCDAGAIPPLAEYYLQFTDHLRVAPL